MTTHEPLIIEIIREGLQAQLRVFAVTRRAGN